MVAVVQEVKVDPFENIKKRMRKFRILAFAAILICIALLVGATIIVVYSGRLSMGAFEDLPRYRVNVLLNDYRDQVAAFDESFAAINGQLEGEAANRVLAQARSLADSVRVSEEGFGEAVQLYGETINAIVEHVGGALEWNRHFQADIDALKKASDKRRDRLAGIVAEFPVPQLPSDVEQEGAEPEP